MMDDGHDEREWRRVRRSNTWRLVAFPILIALSVLWFLFTMPASDR
jgi:hypothetical protein